MCGTAETRATSPSGPLVRTAIACEMTHASVTSWLKSSGLEIRRRMRLCGSERMLRPQSRAAYRGTCAAISGFLLDVSGGRDRGSIGLSHLSRILSR